MSDIIISPTIDAAIKRAEDHIKARPRPMTTNAAKRSSLGVLVGLCGALGGLRAIKQALTYEDAALESMRMLEDAEKTAEDFKRKQRNKLASDLRSARDKLRRIKAHTRTIELQYDVILANTFMEGCQDAPNTVYPKIPTNRVTPTETGKGIPARPGIYFVRDPVDIVYVGQSISLKSRATLLHHNIRCTDAISYIEMDAYMLDFAEAFYIGVCKPTRNFGRTSRYRAHVRIACGGPNDTAPPLHNKRERQKQAAHGGTL